jgi:hypothetical protein
MKRIFTLPLYFLILLYIVLEDLIWKKFAKRITDYMLSLNIFIYAERIISNFHVNVILVGFLILLIISEILGIMAIALIGKGLVISGVILYVAKIPLVSLTFWLFKISKDKLLKINWFNKIYLFIIKILNIIKSSKYYINTMHFVINVKEDLKYIFKKEDSNSKFLTRIKNMHKLVKLKYYS